MTPRLTALPFPLSRPASPPKTRSRSGLGVLCAIASLAAHGALLAMVVPDLGQAPPPVEDLEKLTETPLPPNDVALTVLSKPPVDSPAAVVSAAPVTPTPAAPVPQAAPQAAPAPRPAVQPAAPPQPQPAAAAPAPAPLASPEIPATPDPPGPPALYANFPHLEGAQAACEGLADCWRSPVSSSWRTAAGDLRERLEAQGYTVSNITGEVLSIDSGVRVYAVSKPGEAEYYLNLVSVGEGLLYTMTAEPMTADQVLELQRS